MRNVIIGEPIIVAQSTTEPVFRGGYQDPQLRQKDGVLYLNFNGRKDCHADHGKEDRNPTYRSADGGKTWERATNEDWIAAMPPLPNGDIFQIREGSVLREPLNLPPLPDHRKGFKTCANRGDVYTLEELRPYLGEAVTNTFKAWRIPAGTTAPVEEIGVLHQDRLPFVKYQENLVRYGVGGCQTIAGKVVADNNGALWTTIHGPLVREDGTLAVGYECMHFYRSDDNGRSFTDAACLVYDPALNPPAAKDVEGFLECAFEILEDGTFFVILRTGSLHPFDISTDDNPIPKCYMTRSHDQGKTWEPFEEFYDYGVQPRMVRLGCGTTVMTSGRPGVYIRTSDDLQLREWNDVIPVLTVPTAEVYERYYYYTCSNNALVAYDDHTAFLAYSDFTLTTPDGQPAKSIVVRKITA